MMNQTLYRKMLKTHSLLCFGLTALFVILAKVYAVTCTNVLIMYTAWPEVIEILINLLECVIYGIAYAFFIYIAYRFSVRGLIKFVCIYGGSVLFKYISNYILTWLTDTGMSADYLLENLSYVLIYTVIELAQAGLVLFVICRTMTVYHAFVAKQMRIAQALPDAQVNMRTYAFPFTALISSRNLLQKCALVSGITITGFKIVARLIYDISYGWPTSVVDGLWMVIYYMIDIFAGFAVCLLITYLLMRFDAGEQKK